MSGKELQVIEVKDISPKDYTLCQIRKKMLDNADMLFDLSAYPAISIDFYVYGLVDEKYWKVRFFVMRRFFLKFKVITIQLQMSFMLSLM